MNVTNEMHLTLFNSIADVHEKLEMANKIINNAISDLKSAQVRTEDMYVDIEE